MSIGCPICQCRRGIDWPWAGLILAVTAILIGLWMAVARAQPAAQTRESVAIQVLQSQRNGALDAVVGCTADAQVRTAELQARVDDLTRQLAEAKKVPE